MKGILLAGGRGTRLYPLNVVMSKQLQPIYNKPMIYYPLTTMILAGVRDVLVVSSPEALPHYERLLGDGSRWGLSISFAVQPSPRGIVEALIIGEHHIAGSDCVLMLGDNLIHGRYDFLRRAIREHDGGATIFAYQVADPSAYGVVELGADGHVRSLEEKPAQPRSTWAVPGMYLYGPDVGERAKALDPSARGELEITDLNRTYLEEGRLRARPMGRGTAWFDTGTPENLLAAGTFVHAVESRQGLIIGCPEEAAFRMGYMTEPMLASCIQDIPPCGYRAYLQRVLEERPDP